MIGIKEERRTSLGRSKGVRSNMPSFLPSTLTFVSSFNSYIPAFEGRTRKKGVEGGTRKKEWGVLKEGVKGI
jgi:hypothetical protein